MPAPLYFWHLSGGGTVTSWLRSQMTSWSFHYIARYCFVVLGGVQLHPPLTASGRREKCEHSAPNTGLNSPAHTVREDSRSSVGLWPDRLLTAAPTRFLCKERRANKWDVSSRHGASQSAAEYTMFVQSQAWWAPGLLSKPFQSAPPVYYWLQVMDNNMTEYVDGVGCNIRYHHRHAVAHVKVRDEAKKGWTQCNKIHFSTKH